MDRTPGDIASKYTYPLYSVFDGKHGIDGSSILVKSGVKHYLITARHVGIESGKVKLFGECGQLPLDDFLILPETIDISIVSIQRPDLFMENGFDFLPIDYWGINTILRPRESNPNYLLLGYPYTRTRREVVGRKSLPIPFGFRTWVYGQEEHDLLQCPTLTHFALRYLCGKLHDEKRGEHIQAPNLRGMSGGGVWDISGPYPVLVGILIEQWPITNPIALVATRIDAISEFLRSILGDDNIPMSQYLIAKGKINWTS
jgi:hypothetical protein